MDIEERKAKQREYYQKTIDERRAKRKAYYWAHRDKALADRAAYQRENKDKLSAYRKEYYRKNTERLKEQNHVKSKKYNDRMRRQIIEHYGGKCACCGEDTIEFLAIDHINGGGNEHRRSIRATSTSTFYKWVIDNNYPDTLQLLCHNCNMAKGFYGVCPHQKEK